MRVLFISSANNSNCEIYPMVKSQGRSLREQGIDLDYFPILGKGLTGYLKNTYRLKKYLDTHEYEIVHAHNGLCGVFSYFAVAGRDYPQLVVSFMGDDLVGENRWDGSYTCLGNLMVSINKWFAGKKFKTIIVKSRQMQEILNHIDSIILPNGVDFKQFFPMDKQECRGKLGIPLEENLILFVADPGRPEKNFHLAKQAAALLPGEQRKIRVIQGMSPDVLNMYYNAADVCLLTSFHEGSPNVIKEAMACNCPVVSTDVGDVRNVTGNTRGCFLTSFEPGDVAAKLKLALAFGQRTDGRSNIVHLENSIIAGKLIAIYQAVVNRENRVIKNSGSREI